ncbi:MAG: DUF4325 domain-containing protein [Sphaerochaetaceae bacterium]
MKLTKEVQDAIVKFVIDSVETHPNDLVTFVSQHFEISRPTTTRLINGMLQDGSITRANYNKGKNPGYKLATKQFTYSYSLVGEQKLQEDRIYYSDIMPHLLGTPSNVQQILEYSAAEMINNAIDHSEGKVLDVLLETNVKKICMMVADDGVGIFNKIQRELDLQTPQQSILELCKGKYTSDPQAHTGEGIFFTSRMVDDFNILSYGLFFSGHDGSDFIIEHASGDGAKGTTVFLEVNLDTKKSAKEVFDKFANPDVEPGFFRTCIPVRLMNIEGGQLLSRSQGKRMMARVERFVDVILDFNGVEMIGQAFADEVFRVFQSLHKEVRIRSINTNESIANMIKHVNASAEVIRRKKSK